MPRRLDFGPRAQREGGSGVVWLEGGCAWVLEARLGTVDLGGLHMGGGWGSDLLAVSGWVMGITPGRVDFGGIHMDSSDLRLRCGRWAWMVLSLVLLA
jgi:hypothetical protein